MIKEGYVSISVRYPEEMKIELGHISADTGKSKNKLIIEATQTFIASYNMLQKAKRRKRG